MIQVTWALAAPNLGCNIVWRAPGAAVIETAMRWDEDIIPVGIREAGRRSGRPDD